MSNFGTLYKVAFTLKVGVFVVQVVGMVVAKVFGMSKSYSGGEAVKAWDKLVAMQIEAGEFEARRIDAEVKAMHRRLNPEADEFDPEFEESLRNH